MNIIGVDPGAKGGIAIIDSSRYVEVYSLVNMTASDIRDLFAEISLRGPCHAIVEKVWGLPGCAGQFVFGRNAGWLEMALACTYIPFSMVSPQTWMRGVGMAGLKMEKRDRKRALLTAAQQLFPDVKITLATADALLMAEYGCRESFRGALCQPDV